MRFGSVCSGIEAASAAWHSLGWEPSWFSEIESFPSAVLAHHYPEVPNKGDMTKFKEWGIARGSIDVLVGGTPCQAFSVAGMRAGLSDERGGLSLTFCQLADEIDPKWVLWENVPGVLSSKDNAFGCFLAGLCGADEPLVCGGSWPSSGVVSGPKRTAAWRVLDAQYFGVAQRRRRVFVLAVRGSRNWACAAALFPIGESVYGDSAPSRKAGEEVAGTLASRAGAGGGLGTDFDLAGGVQVAPPVAMALTTSQDRLGDGSDQDFVVHAPDCAATLTSHWHNSNGASAGNNGGVINPVITVSLRGREGGGTAELGGDLAGTVRASQGGGDKPHVLTRMSVRRLTPRECERLQGFPDDWTLIPWRRKPADECPDGPRYKAIGNSMAVPVMRWLGKRIEFVSSAYRVAK